jgi:3-hydroxybutyrate dehydrogenase
MLQLASSAASRGMTEEQLISDVLLRPQPIGRFVSVDEVAALAQYLCSDEASAVTGAMLSIDGGWTTQ